MRRIEKMNELVEKLGAEEVLEALVRAMSEQEAEENFDYIEQMHELADDDKVLIRCNNCSSEFEDEDELEFFYEDNDNLESGYKGCPECETDEYLMDLR